jgi:hypothetical protein
MEDIISAVSPYTHTAYSPQEHHSSRNVSFLLKRKYDSYVEVESDEYPPMA